MIITLGTKQSIKTQLSDPTLVSYGMEMITSGSNQLVCFGMILFAET